MQTENSPPRAGAQAHQHGAGFTSFTGFATAFPKLKLPKWRLPRLRIPSLAQLFSEEFILKLVFRVMVLSAISVVIIDFRNMMDVDESAWPGARPLIPVTMEPPSKSDNIRPYLPKAAPIASSGGKVILPGYTTAPTAEALSRRMTFRIDRHGRASAVGQIEPGTAGEFERFLLNQKNKVTSIYLHSPGGSVRDALDIARLIRKHKIATVVPNHGYCASSCPLVFAGGHKRAAGPKAWIGVHQVYTLPSTLGSIHDGMAQAQKISAVCQKHLWDMGVDPRAWVHAMNTPKRQLYVFTSEELIRYNLATRIVRQTQS